MNMSLLGGLIFGAIFGGSAIKCAAENANRRVENVYYLPDGTPYWYDRKGCTRLMDGTIIYVSYDKVTDIHNNVLYDRLGEENNAIRKKVMSSDCKYKYAAQHNIRTNGDVTTDLIAHKVVARIQEKTKKDGSVEYRKWYLYDEVREKFGKMADYAIKIQPTIIKDGDPGIVISKEEYDAIENCATIYENKYQYPCRSYKKKVINEITGKEYII